MRFQTVHPSILSTMEDFQRTANPNVWVRPCGDLVVIVDANTAYLLRMDENPVTVM